MRKTYLYIIFTILVVLAFFLTGERYVFHIAHFENTYFSMTLQYEIFGDDTVESAELSKEKIKQVSQEQQFDLFFLKKERISEIGKSTRLNSSHVF